MAEEIFDIVDEQDMVVSTAPRSVAHKQGLRHRAIHVLFVTPKGDVVLQKRSMTKDTYPGYWTVTVGGHVGSSRDYLAAAVAEISEETGLTVAASSLVPVSRMECEYHDPITGAHDNEFIMVYGHVFRGDVANLKIEEGEGTGFTLFPLLRLSSMTEDMREREKIVPILTGFYKPLYAKLLALISSPRELRSLPE